MICHKCGVNNPANYSFCTDCGVSLIRLDMSTPLDVTWSYSPQARAETLLGQIIESKYRLDSILGVGGMGTVFCAARLNLGDQVAIKILHPELMQEAEAAERFYREAQMAARVKHPNAIHIFDVGVTPNGSQFIVMEFFEGISLRQIIKQQSPLDLKFITTVISQICGALDEAHRCEITHRDIKPDNVLVAQVSNKIHVKVLDFGIAKLLDHSATNLTLTGSVMGTPQYMSPEQCMGDELDHRADIYSLGVVLYEMLCGEVPFNAINPNAIAVQHVQKPPPSLLKCNYLTPKIEQVVLRALAKNPNERQPTAGDLGYELDLAVSESLGITTPITVDSVSLKKKEIDYQPPQENTARSNPVSGAETNANQPTLVNRIDVRSGKQTPFSYSLSGSQQTAPRKIPFGTIAVIALVVLILAGGVGGLMFLNSSKTDESAAKDEDDSKKITNQNSQAKDELSNPPTGMVYVPGGSFMMGGDKQTYEGGVFLSPPHEVFVKPFFIDIYEVTCEDYKNFITATNYPPPKGWNGNDFPVGKARFPVTDVNWDVANAYAKWAGKRLPTEVEWEFAARGSDGRLYSWGNEWKDDMANADNINRGMVEVGSYKKGASPFGIYDLIGNAWEWTATTLEPYPNGTMPAIDEAKKNVEFKIIRGGTWSNNKEIATTTRRGFYGAREERRYSNTSFRCVKDLEGK